MKYITQLTSMAICLLLILSISINYNGKIWGYDLNSDNRETETLVYDSDGTILVHTQEIAKDISGYGGNIPLILHIKNRIITDIEILNHSETPEFIDKVKKELLPEYIGKSIDDPKIGEIEAISGATMTSDAVKKSVNKGINYLQGNMKKPQSLPVLFPLKITVAILVTLAAAIIPLFVKSHGYRIIQLILNVTVLGLWCGSFISYSSLISFFSNGLVSPGSLLFMILFTVAFIYPVFNKKNHYCTWVYPLGSIQELAGKCVRKKIGIPQTTLARLQTVRKILWSVLMLFMWAGIFMKWIDYEPFSIFIYSNASIPVIVIAVIFILLSFFINRPYCRFVCPTGTLLRLSQNSKL